ncbi:hypothetical protein C4573_01240 [Candidatus Woesearchaeota archaeon]|nr:MAG: hypothetical protein C4573_01240 [Candidatus Woesearchaeota archaeon]
MEISTFGKVVLMLLVVGVVLFAGVPALANTKGGLADLVGLDTVFGSGREKQEAINQIRDAIAYCSLTKAEVCGKVESKKTIKQEEVIANTPVQWNIQEGKCFSFAYDQANSKVLVNPCLK